MKRYLSFYLNVFLLSLLALPAFGQIDFEKDFEKLFEDVQLNALFPDSKTFVDCIPRAEPKKIMAMYLEQKDKSSFNLKEFVNEHFDLPPNYSTNYKNDGTTGANIHIARLWPILTRQPDSKETNSSLIPLPYPYIVPGGRFGEIYYWDSYFTMLGLKASKQDDMMENMVNNFAYLIGELGFIPNGNRTYFSGRSQPPFFAVVVKLLAKVKGTEMITKYLPQMVEEHYFWMEGYQNLSENNKEHRRVVWLEEEVILNRHYDDRSTPRPESYKEDVHLSQTTERPSEELFRDLRAACESGWDFSSRWLTDSQKLETIETTKIIPVDLNALLYYLELTIAQAYNIQGNKSQYDVYTEYAQRRREALYKYCWDDEGGFFTDYNFIKKSLTKRYCLAGMYPLFFRIANYEQAQKVALKIRKDFLKPGGVTTTLVNSGQQWDAPNGWAPLQWITIQGLRNYDEFRLAEKIRSNWINNNLRVYKNTAKMVEKYNVENLSLEAGGGEYPVQDGFGWSNGVLLRLLAEESER